MPALSIFSLPSVNSENHSLIIFFSFGFISPSISNFACFFAFILKTIFSFGFKSDFILGFLSTINSYRELLLLLSSMSSF